MIRILSILLVSMVSAQGALACSAADVESARVALVEAETRFSVGEISIADVAGAHMVFAENQVCLDQRTLGLTCDALRTREEQNLTEVRARIEVGENDLGDLRHALLRVAAALDLCL